MACEFSLDHYFETLEKYRRAKYRFSLMRDAKQTLDSEEKVLILRHDVDLSLTDAYWMAHEEFEHGIKSSYYLLLYSALYNPALPKYVARIKEMTKWGHEIGLHIDTANMINMQKEVRWLEAIVNLPVETYSHYLVSETPPLDSATRAMNRNLVDANDMTDENTIKYLSDSGRNWREGCFCQHIDRWDRMQVVIHPEWWVSKDTSKDILDLIGLVGNEAINDINIAEDEWRDRLSNYLEKFGIVIQTKTAS
jgi:hypothetical protein